MKALAFVCQGLKFPSIAQRCKGHSWLFPSTVISKAQPCSSSLLIFSKAPGWGGQRGEGGVCNAWQGGRGLVGSRGVCREGGTGHPGDREGDMKVQGEGSLWGAGKGKGERRADVG